MIDPIYDDLPDDEELAFLKLEREYRDRCESDAFDAKRNEENGYVPSDIYLRYMRQTTAIAQELKLDILEEQSRIPSAENFSLSDYRDFIGQVDYHRTVFQLRQARRAKGFSVRFDNNTKRIITHHLNQVRELILSLEVDEWKKESLLTCLNNLQAEVDKDRSGYDVFAAFVIEAAGVLGAAGERLESIRRIIDSVASLIWGTKHAEQTKRVPPPAERKKIPPPKTQLRKNGMDDEIPF